MQLVKVDENYIFWVEQRKISKSVNHMGESKNKTDLEKSPNTTNTEQLESEGTLWSISMVLSNHFSIF